MVLGLAVGVGEAQGDSLGQLQLLAGLGQQRLHVRGGGDGLRGEGGTNVPFWLLPT